MGTPTESASLLKLIACNRESLDYRDVHHLLYEYRHWTRKDCPSAGRLRRHRYMKVKIPRQSLHDRIHATLNDVPVPSESICAETCDELDRLLAIGKIQVKTDPIEKRLQFLIDFWSQYSGASDSLETIKIQKCLVDSYYAEKLYYFSLTG